MTKPLTIKEELLRLRKQNTRLAVKNIVLWANLRTIAENPDSKQAQKLLEMYRQKLAAEKESEQATQN